MTRVLFDGVAWGDWAAVISCDLSLVWPDLVPRVVKEAKAPEPEIVEGNSSIDEEVATPVEEDYNSSDYSLGECDADAMSVDALDGGNMNHKKRKVADANAPTVAPWKPVGQEGGEQFWGGAFLKM
jgi:hypothetical protein